MSFKRLFSRMLSAAALAGLLGFASTAFALPIAPTSPPSAVAPSCTGPGTGNDPAWIASFCPSMSGLTEQYKQDEGAAADVGPLAGSYTTVFNGDLSGGTITYNGGSFVNCGPTSPCWLLVKDGNQTPGRYAFNLSLVWNGVEQLVLSGFWPDNGAISHVALYGGVTASNGGQVSEPATSAIALLGLGLLGAALRSRRRSKEG